MCVCFWVQDSRRYKFILAANRDEFISRATSRAAFYSTGNDPLPTPSASPEHVSVSGEPRQVLSGVDLDAHRVSQTSSTVVPGTWAGISRSGRVAFLTNVRESEPQSVTAKSRGLLPGLYLSSRLSALEYCEKVEQTAEQEYNGFNLVVGDVSSSNFCYVSNRPAGASHCPISLDPGVVYGLSNDCLAVGSQASREWPKVARGKRLFEDVLAREEELSMSEMADQLISTLLADTHPCDIPLGMFDNELEERLASICVPLSDRLGKYGKGMYGTKTHTIVLVDRQDQVRFVEVELYALNGAGDGHVLRNDRREFTFSLQA